MRIINCHIENFGRLSGYDRDFTDGCNAIMASNGQGKSTLAAFIRVMFYGFEGEGKRRTGENERKRYEPWQGGVYGGRLTFSDGEKTYVIQRTFGNKSSEDTFELRDASTNLVSDAYSENIGEELFKVNSESYMRTAYIGQNDVVTHTTDGINSMIGGIADNTNDLDSYEKALGRLNDLINKESPTRSTGSLYKLEGDVTALRTRVRDGSVILDSIHRLEDNMEESKEELAKHSDIRKELAKKQQKLGAYKDRQALKSKYDSLSEECKERDDEVKVRRVAFPGEVPDMEKLNAMQEKATQYAKICESVTFHTLTHEETDKLAGYDKKFEPGIPDMNETTELIRKLRDHDKSMSEDTSDKAELKVLESELDAVKKDKKRLPSSATVGMALILIAMIAAVASVILMPSNALRWVGVGISALILIAGVAVTAFGLKKHKSDCEMDIKDIESKMGKLRNRIDSGERYRRSVMEQARAYLDRYGMALDPVSVTEDLRYLHTMADEYLRLKDKKSDHEKAAEQKNKYKLEFDKYLAELSIVSDDDYVKTFSRLSMDLRSYDEAVARASKAAERLKDFEKENDIEALKNLALPEDDMTLEQINEKLAEVTGRIDEIAGRIRDESDQHDALAEKLELWEEDQVSLGVKEKQLFEGKHRYKNIKNASKYLTLAKESITAKYMEPLLTGFSKYYSSVTGAPADKYHIDANTNITVDELGGQRDTSLLSTGYQDLIGFCLRLALIDAMYEDEKPVLVLDDPFVNLDAERLEGAKRLMDTLAANYQMIYFTCR